MARSVRSTRTTPAPPAAVTGLRRYQQMRDFQRTPEPRGAPPKTRRHEAAPSFVIQKHAASHLHHDFRLELDGVLLSWAVPKGPPTAAGGRALAMRTEDHPLEYGGFEGVIPKGQYGGGTVMLWDRGTWSPEGDPHAGLRAGKLDFRLDGERLQGRWSLVRMRGKPHEAKEAWLLVKRSDPAGTRASADMPDDRSVATGRSMAQIAAAYDREWTAAGETPAAKLPRPQRASRPAAATAQAKKPTEPRATAGAANVEAMLDALPGVRRAPRLPGPFVPQLATLAEAPPEGDEWLHEVKFDGYRMLAFLDAGTVRLVTRTGQDWTDRFPTIAAAVAALPTASAVLDGEVCVLLPDGRTDFQSLQNRLEGEGPRAAGNHAGGKRTALVYYVFDLPWCLGRDLARVPLQRRKEALARVLGEPAASGTVRYSDHIAGNGALFFGEVQSLGLEGIVSKRANAVYETRRTRTWLKVKALRRQELVVGGWTEPSGSRSHFGALLLGYHEGGELHYAGKVGTGFDVRALDAVMKKLRPLAQREPPFATPPRGADARRAHWVRPECVVEVAFTEWTGDGRLRHPSFQGLREDKDPRSIGRERATPPPPAATTAAAPTKTNARARAGAKARAKVATKAMAKAGTRRAPGTATRTTVQRGLAAGVEVAGVVITNPDRVLWPEVPVTKVDLARYYEAAAPLLLPHVVARPLTLVRCPGGRLASCFYQKHVSRLLPPPVRAIPVREEKGMADYVGIDDLRGLVTLVQFGVVELHPWGSREDALERPDRLVMDLDPHAAVPWPRVVQAAHDLRDLLSRLGLRSFPRTTGGKGLHVVAPIERRVSWDDLKQFAADLAAALARTEPRRFVTVMTKSRREGRIFVDYLRNGRGATAIANLSARAREGAPVAMPLAWEMLTPELDPRAFTVRTVPGLLAAAARAWRGFAGLRQNLTASARAAVRQL